MVDWCGSTSLRPLHRALALGSGAHAHRNPASRATSGPLLQVSEIRSYNGATHDCHIDPELHAELRGQRPSQRMSADRRRLALALLLSLLLHAPLLSLTFGGQGFGLPGFNFPWRERRTEVPDLRVVLVPAQVTASEPTGTSASEPLQQASIAQTVAGGPTLTPFVASAPVLRETAEAIVQKGEAESKPDTATAAVPAKTLLRTDEAVLAAPAAPLAVPAVIAVAPSEMKPAFVMPVPQDAGEAAQKPAELEVREQSVEVPKPDFPASEAQQERQRHSMPHAVGILAA